MNPSEISNAYLELIGAEQWTTPDNFYFLVCTQKDYDSPYFKYVVDHKSELEAKVNLKHLNWYIRNTMNDGIYLVAASQDAKKRKHFIRDIKLLMPEDKQELMIDELNCNYAYNNRPHTGARIKGMRKFYHKYVVPENLNAVAWNLYEHEKDIRMIRFALELVDKALEKEDKNAFYLDTKVRILQKLGKYNEALKIAIVAEAIAKEQGLSFHKELIEIIKTLKIKTGA